MVKNNNNSHSKDTRSFLNDALKDFRTKPDPNERLRSLWKIGQLIDRTTDEELYELAAAAAVEEDHRVRGEICYAISRSQRPGLKNQLIQLLRAMAQDDDHYVRRSAITALGELGGIRELTLATIDPVLDDVESLKAVVEKLGQEMISLHESIQEFSNADSSVSDQDETVMDDYMISWETYLRHENKLLQEHKGDFVAIYRDKIVGIDDDQIKLAEDVYDKYGLVEALICKIEVEDEPIQIPPARVIVG
ncbi:hypothetical protein GF312_22595 [Candidatus Poribacteria bacterium]|nr:hypothetical protein [Candidatus Poribacteria bacterium]